MKKIIICLSILLFFVSCYHSTGLQEPVSIVSKINESNYDAYIDKSPHMMGSIGDYYVSNTKFYLIVDGGIVGERRQNFLAPTGGSIIDFGTILNIDSLGNKQSSNNDYINQIFQVINQDVNTPIAYTNINVEGLSENSATIKLTGYPMDNGGLFANAGVAVDPSTKLVKSVQVETTYTLEKSDTYLTMTTIVKNNSGTKLPIKTVGDYHYLGGNALRAFIPAPGYGYTPEIGSNNPIYVPFISFDESKPQFSWIYYQVYAPDDGTLMVTFGNSTGEYKKAGNKFATVNKPMLEDGLNSGEAITFVRYIEPKSSDAIHTSIINFPTAIKTSDENPINTLTKLGNISGQVLNTGQVSELVVTAEQVEPGLYYNGESVVESSVPVPVAAARIHSDGNFSLSVPSGIYQLRIQGNNIENKIVSTYRYFDAGADTEDSSDDIDEIRPITVEEDKNISVGDIEVRKVSKKSLLVSVSDANSIKTAVRATLTKDGVPGNYFLDQEEAEKGSLNYYFDYYGDRLIPLNEGSYTIYLSKGFTYPLEHEDVTVTSTTDDSGVTTVTTTPETIEKTYTESVEREGYLAFDPTIRTAHSYNCSITPINRFIASLTEGLDVIMSNDVNKVSEYLDIYASLESRYRNETSDTITMDRDALHLIYGVTTKSFYPGDKTPITGFGEFSVFPVDSKKGEKGFGVGDTGYRTFATVYDLVKRNNTRTKFSMLMRPRSNETTPNGIIQGLFQSLNETVPASLNNSFFSRVSELGTGTTNKDFDLIEVLSGNHYDEYLKVRLDWFNILLEGNRKFAAGGSGYNLISPYFSGSPRTYVQYTEDVFNEDNFLAEFAAGHSFISSGPYLTVNSNGTLPGNEITKSNGKVSLSIKVQAPDWIPVDEVRVIVNGEVVEKINISDKTSTVRYSETLEVDVPDVANSFIVVECGASLENIEAGIYPHGDFALVYPGIQPIAFTNPFFVN